MVLRGVGCKISDLTLTLAMVSNTEHRSSAIAYGPRDALCQLKSCQLLHTCATKSQLEKLAVGE